MNSNFFNNLPEDVQRKIALELSPSDLINFCLTEKQKMDKICNSDIFWRLKLEKDFRQVFYYYKKHNIILKNPKNTYMRLFTEQARFIEDKLLNEIEEIRKDKRIFYFDQREIIEDIETNFKQIVTILLNVLNILRKYSNYPLSLAVTENLSFGDINARYNITENLSDEDVNIRYNIIDNLIQKEFSKHSEKFSFNFLNVNDVINRLHLKDIIMDVIGKDIQKFVKIGILIYNPTTNYYDFL